MMTIPPPQENQPPTNFGTSSRAFTPPTDGQGINAPREIPETPRPQVNTAQIYESWHQDDSAPAATNDNAITTDGQAAIAKKRSKRQLSIVKISTIIFGALSAAYFAINVFDIARGWIESATNISSSLSAATGALANIGSTIWTMIISITLFLLFLVMLVASVNIVRLRDSGRKTWLKSAIVITGFLLFVTVQSLYSINEIYNKYSSESESLSSIASQQDNQSIKSQLIETDNYMIKWRSIMIREVVTNMAIWLIPCVFGWVWLTRSKVREQFT